MSPSNYGEVSGILEQPERRMATRAYGGIRRGSDILKAIALGTRAASIGQAYPYGLGAAGERVVDHVLDLPGVDVRRTMALIGAPTITDSTGTWSSDPAIALTSAPQRALNNVQSTRSAGLPRWLRR